MRLVNFSGTGALPVLPPMIIYTAYQDGSSSQYPTEVTIYRQTNRQIKPERSHVDNFTIT